MYSGYMSERMPQSEENWDEVPEVIEGRERKKGWDISVSEASVGEHEDEPNEDRVLVDEEDRLYGVFDGVARRRGGGWAAEKASEYVATQKGRLPHAAAHVPRGKDPAHHVAQEAGRIVKEADLFVKKKATEEGRGFRRGGEERFPGTTATFVQILTLADGRRGAAYACVGNGRLYLMRKGVLYQVTWDNQPEDKERILRLAEIGSEEEYAKLDSGDRVVFTYRNILKQVVGGNEAEVEPEAGWLDLIEGDRLGIFDDGVHDSLKGSDIQFLMSNPSVTAEAVVEAARAVAADEGAFRGKPDDASGLIIEINGLEPIEKAIPASVPEKQESADPSTEVAACTTFEQLYAVIRRLPGGGVNMDDPDERKRVSSEDIIAIIEAARKQTKPSTPDLVTSFMVRISRIYGLRAKAASLLHEEHRRTYAPMVSDRPKPQA